MSQQKQKVLLTGANGYLGSNLLAELLESGFEVIACVRSTSNLDRIKAWQNKIQCYQVDEVSLQQIFDSHTIDVIIHSATNYGRLISEYNDIHLANVDFPMRLCKVAEQAQVGCFINTDTCLDADVSPYAFTKAEFRNWLRNDSKISCKVNLRLQHFFGPADDPKKFVSWIMHSILTSVEQLDLTAGEQLRDFIYIKDVVRFYLKLLHNLDTVSQGSNFIDLDLGTGTTITIRQMVEAISQLVPANQTKLNFGAKSYRKNEAMHSVANLESLKGVLEWNPEYSIEAGLKEMLRIEKRKKLQYT